MHGAAVRRAPGVVATTSGYIGGQRPTPLRGGLERGQPATRSGGVLYYPAKVSYERLLDVFWHTSIPTVRDRQFCDTGNQYRPASLFHDETQSLLARQSKQALEKSKPFKEAIVTESSPPAAFYPRRSHHQDYYKKNPLRYKF